MAHIELFDAHNLLGLSTPVQISFFRALLLLAIATSPAPGSRYQPGSRWAILKYAPVYDPRSRSRTRTMIVNAGIEDLDPHQKAVLADDIGVALALEVLDQRFGVVGLADVYQVYSAGYIDLHREGRHRKMPDFLLLLDKPINGSNPVLLECKGSVRRDAYASQLQTACTNQLDNVARISGHTGNLPRLAVAARLSPGEAAHVHVSDPPEEAQFGPELRRVLMANWLALEFQFFGAVRSANAVWEASRMRSWLLVRQDEEPDAVELRWIQAMGQTLLHSKKRRGSVNAQIATSDYPACDVEVVVEIEASASARRIRQHEAWKDFDRPLEIDATQGSDSEQPEVRDAATSTIREASRTSYGVSIRQTSTLTLLEG